MKKTLTALVVVAMSAPVIASATAATTPHPKFITPMIRLGEEPPNVPIVLPENLPVPDPVAGDKIGPGSYLLITNPAGSFLCTANFVWTGQTTSTTTTTTGHGKKKKTVTTTTTTEKTYLGAAGHCFLPTPDQVTGEGGATSTAGPDADYDPANTSVSVCVEGCSFGGQLGALAGTFMQLGPVAYARQTLDGVDVGNDFGIVEIPASVPPDMVRPSEPIWGGPSKAEDVTAGAPVCVYGNGEGVGETFPTKARAGLGEAPGDNGRSWAAVLPSFEGDSGSAVLTCAPDAAGGLQGAGAAGILTHLSPFGGVVVGTTTGRAAEMVKQDTGITLLVNLADGTKVAPVPPPPMPPPSPIPPDEAVHDVAVGGQYSWSAGPFTRQADTGSVLGEQCSGEGTKSDYCDYEWVNLVVPSGGAQLTVTVSTANADTDDFDLFVFGPNGKLVKDGSSASSGTPPEVVSTLVKTPGTYTIAVDPFSTNNASYDGVVKLDPYTAPPPPPPPATLVGDPHIYQGGVIDPFLAGGDAVLAGEPVSLSVRFLHSNSASVTLAIDANGQANFTASDRVTKDGQLAFGPFAATVDTDSSGFQTNYDWTVPSDAASGSYVFEAYVTVGGQTYQVATLPFEIP